MTSFDKNKSDTSISHESISDEKLSAFLDSELPEKEMEFIRDLLAADETLVDRIAEMASVDAIVSSTYHQIDDVPLPQSVQQLLNSADVRRQPANNVVDFPLWQRIKSGWQAHARLATAAALVIGLGVGLTTNLSDSSSADHWSAITQVLDQQASGQTVAINNGYSVMPRVTFTNNNEQFCRQFVLNTPSNRQQSIACHNSDGWQVQATIYTQPDADGSYQTATTEQPINSLVESMAVGAFLDTTQENNAIRAGWSN